MTATLTAVPSQAGSQLFFDFDSTPIVLPSSNGRMSQLAAFKQNASPRVTTQRREQIAIPVAESLVEQRGQGEVKLGAVMIQLLKRYGITDAEIAEGLEEYARKRACA